jgi:hypothetical protein
MNLRVKESIEDREHLETPELRVWLKAVGVASILTVYGWAAFRFGPHINGFVWAIYPGLLLEFPGGIVGSILDLYVSPQGIHGGEYMWLTTPVNFLFYSVIFFRFFRWRSRVRSLKG